MQSNGISKGVQNEGQDVMHSVEAEEDPLAGVQGKINDVLVLVLRIRAASTS